MGKSLYAKLLAVLVGLTIVMATGDNPTTAEAVAKDFKVSREDQDAFAYESHQRAIIAGFHRREKLLEHVSFG